MGDGLRSKGRMTRRDASWSILKAASIAGGREFFTAWAKADSMSPRGHWHAAGAPPDPHDWNAYQPKFFSKEDFRNLETFSAILIPTDDTPGAREAFVAPFIDFVVDAAAEYAPDMQRHWRDAMAWLRRQNFSGMPAEEQVQFVERISAPERDRSKARDDGFKTYSLIKDMTVHAFYTSRVGLVDVLEYKGLAYLTEFPACTHPEHHRI